MHCADDGLPIGTQLADRVGDEATLIRLAAQLDQACPGRIGDRRPLIEVTGRTRAPP